MRFCWYSPELSRCSNVLLVGSAEGRVKNLSAWPGQRTPCRLRADTATGSALHLAADPNRRLWLSGIDWVTASHFDTDSLLAVWAVLEPEAALRCQDAVCEAARAATFERFTTARGVQFDLTVRAFDDPCRSPLAAMVPGRDPEAAWTALTEMLLGLLPDALLRPESFSGLWQDEWQAIQRSRSLWDLGEVQVRELAGLSLIETPEPGHWQAWFAAAQQETALAVRPVGGGWTYELRYRPETWYDLPRPAGRERRDCTPLAQALNALEGQGLWHAVPTDYVSLAGLYCGDRRGRRLLPSRLPPEMVTEIIAGYLEPVAVPVTGAAFSF